MKKCTEVNKHKCKTCTKMISKNRTFCGSLTVKDSCARKAIIQDTIERNKKLYRNDRQFSEYERITKRKRDTSCDSSGFF